VLELKQNVQATQAQRIQSLEQQIHSHGDAKKEFEERLLKAAESLVAREKDTMRLSQQQEYNLANLEKKEKALVDLQEQSRASAREAKAKVEELKEKLQTSNNELL